MFIIISAQYSSLTAINKKKSQVFLICHKYIKLINHYQNLNIPNIIENKNKKKKGRATRKEKYSLREFY